MSKTTKSYTEQLQDLCEEYRAEHGDGPIDLNEVASWAIRTKRMEPRRQDVVKMLARDLARAERAQTFRDPQNREVRRNHAVRNEQGILWQEIDKATPLHMRKSSQHRRDQMLNDAIQLDKDTQSWNDNYRPENADPIEPEFNLTNDVLESRLSSDYPDSRPSDDSLFDED